jgi:prevent-host-death family protein
MASRIIPKTDLRDRIRQELAGLGEDTLVITDRGRPVAVAVSVERWNELQERLEDLDDSVAVLEHRSSGQRGRPAASVLSDIEREHTPVRSSARTTG